jgi:hypothetical protein
MYKKDTLQEQYGTAVDSYNNLLQHRQSLEGMWKDCSELTLPYVFPDSDNPETSQLATPYNSIGPSAVNSLASKLLLALLPPTGNFFRLFPNEEDIADLGKEELDALDKELSKLEQDVNVLVNIQALRVPLFEALKLLIITGNSLLYKVPNMGLKIFSPYQYVVQRDYTGTVTTIVIKEKVAKATLPKAVTDLLAANEENTKQEEKKNVEVYTAVNLESPNKYVVFQEINGVLIPNTVKRYTKETMPYLPLRWTSIANEDYGRGLVEQYLGDLRSLEGITQMIVEGGGIMAKTIFGLKPAASTKVEDLRNALNGDFILGDLEKDITTLQVGKNADLQVPYKLMEGLEQRLAKAFLVFSSQVRDSERTTASEVRLVANELEATLGGVFSVLAQDLQLPLLTLLLNEIEPKVLKVTTPAISTGINAISRERDFQNLNTMMQTLAQLGPEVVGMYLDMPKYLSKIAASLGMDPQDIIKSTEQIEKEQKQMAMQQQAMQQQEQQARMNEIQAKQGGMNG